MRRAIDERLRRSAGPYRLPGQKARWMFPLWAPRAETVVLELLDPESCGVVMAAHEGGLWTAEVEGLSAGDRYRYRLRHCGEDEWITRPDPASHSQPEGVHGPSALVNHAAHGWSVPEFTPPPLNELILYELHVGTFSTRGTFDAAIKRLDHLVNLGVTGVEVMPVAPCPGKRNWGYDGVSLFAVHEAYGGPEGFKRFNDACHERGLAVVLDVVYNHLGPEGNYLRDFGPYFTNAYKTPWGEAVNFDAAGSDFVRGYFIANALHWLERYHIDGFRLDAVHAIYDRRPVHILAELADTVDEYEQATGRLCHVIAETHDNNPRLVTPTSAGGLGMDSAWSDDFHHAMHALLTGEREGFYADYGSPTDAALTLEKGFAFEGQYSQWMGRSHGAPAHGLAGETFTIFLQTHDMVGNRAGSDRLAALVPMEACRAATVTFLLAPYIPLLFMGEEYAETNPFNYFVHHGDDWLVQSVREGRKREFSKFRWRKEPTDPQAESTFLDSRLDWDKLEQPRHAAMLALYTALLKLRRENPALKGCDRDGFHVLKGSNASLGYTRATPDRSRSVCVIANLGAEDATLLMPPSAGETGWRLLLDTGEERFGGRGALLPETAGPGGLLSLGPWTAGVYEG
ncbi:malto-oligosyltrehalose trehalohydrolase [Oceanidesulfovibrio marinus]|uniref:Malto-oligosyltrehalose trehalohydrolase n=1 Tax=Oceanidesulfovibrio marinus TaxID=370038 RepID=A0A6P1ZE53_9BACT|nr:malto-oligosyltrehalose trehalohydrolase [Oceanidesulfovibrio marinus]TVM32843.1 malto-oligosyltrehalose trehalohydrolase [Oceanidesulfovibrio marinus]